MLDGGHAGTRADLRTVLRQAYNEHKTTHLVLVGVIKEVFAIWFPRNDIRESRAQLRILLIARYLPSFKTKTRVDTEALIIKIPGEASTLQTIRWNLAHTRTPLVLISSPVGG